MAFVLTALGQKTTALTTTGQKTTSVGINLIKHYEGDKLKAYRDAGGIWTIGRGHTKGVKKGMVITEASSDAFLLQDIVEFEDYVNGKARRSLKWNERDALVSFTYNAGYRLKGDLANAINYSAPKTVAYLLRKYNKAKIGGVLKILPGLTKRRNSESLLYENGELVLS